MPHFYEWGSNVSRVQPLQGVSLLFTTELQGSPGTYLINLGKMKGWANLGATQLPGPPDWESSALTTQTVKHAYFIIYVQTFQTFKNGTKTSKIVSLFMQRFVHYKPFSLRQENQESAQNDHIWLMIILWISFKRQPPSQTTTFERPQEWLSCTGLPVVSSECKMNLS